MTRIEKKPFKPLMMEKPVLNNPVVSTVEINGKQAKMLAYQDDNMLVVSEAAMKTIVKLLRSRMTLRGIKDGLHTLLEECNSLQEIRSSLRDFMQVQDLMSMLEDTEPEASC